MTAKTAAGVSMEVLEDRWNRFESLPNGLFNPKMLKLCRALKTAVSEVAMADDDDEAPLEDELLDMIEKHIIRRVAEGACHPKRAAA